jgi:hypothetical protein
MWGKDRGVHPGEGAVAANYHFAVDEAFALEWAAQGGVFLA